MSGEPLVLCPLIEIPDGNLHSAFRVRDRAQIADVAISADPNRCFLGQEFSGPGFQPLVELDGIPASISMR